eukprot:4567523-Pleurochrysis_carterae.AAC.1
MERACCPRRRSKSQPFRLSSSGPNPNPEPSNPTKPKLNLNTHLNPTLLWRRYPSEDSTRFLAATVRQLSVSQPASAQLIQRLPAEKQQQLSELVQRAG